MDRSHAREDERHKKAGKNEQLKLTKLSDADDVEAYLTTFERMMKVYEIEDNKWAFRLAPLLTGRAQQAYAALNADDAQNYNRVKEAILRRYDISEETYRQRFRSTTRKEGEAYSELAIRLQDLFVKWTTECKTVAEVREKMVVEQLLNTMPNELRIWVGERKPKTSTETGRLADDYLQARRREDSGSGWPGKSRQEARRCNNCGQVGHLARSCWRKSKESTEEDKKGVKEVKKEVKKEKSDSPGIRCFNCKKMGHKAVECPEKVYFCGEGRQADVTRRGLVDGTVVDDIVLDTGCSRTMVRRELVKEDKTLEGRAVTVRCAHGDTVLYPLAHVELELDGTAVEVEAAVSDNLPVSVLLGTDVPELGRLLQSNPSTVHSTGVERALVVTRAQARAREEQEKQQALREVQSGAIPNVLQEQQEMTPGEAETGETSSSDMFGSNFEDDIFGNAADDRRRLTRSQKRAERQKHGLERAMDRPKRKLESDPVLGIGIDELRKKQELDKSLANARNWAENATEEVSEGYFFRGGLLYRKWVARKGEANPVDQIVLPKECRQAVLHLAHTIPLGGHLAKKKTANRILRRFYWPTIYRDVAEYCQSCQECQKCSSRKSARAPLIPLPVIGEPFERMAMDIVGPLPRSRSGSRYVLVVCDYATRYPEAVPLRTIDAECVAAEIVKIFARVGIPKEILTDQGSNFTSKFLAEVYKLLRIDALRTSPYHPQTDGLVERFNQTLKAMLRKTAKEDGKDWDKWLPYLLFAYREVPQEATGFSPFELVYGREVRGPLDVLKEAWESDSEKTCESVASHVVAMRERLEEMKDLVEVNMAQAQAKQKQWYDRTARERIFQAGEQVLVLLPTSTSKLLAQWQGPFEVVKAVGRVNYLIDMRGRRKRKRIFHVNMLRKWHTPASVSYLCDEIPDESEEIPDWKDDDVGDMVVGDQLTREQKSQLGELLVEFKDVFQKFPGCTDITEHVIEVSDASPIRLPPYRLPHSYRETVKAEIQEMLKQGIIEPSTSDWAAPLVLVKKKDGSLRLCVDFRRLNSVTKADAYPMPRVDEMLDRLGPAKYISTLDLTRGYWQVPVQKESQPMTAFVTPFGLFQFRRMPFGLQGAPATFQRMMDRLLDGMNDFADSYIDDLAVFSTSWDDHLHGLRQVLEKLRAANLTVKGKKCQFGMAECSYLGHVIGGGRVKVDGAKVEAVRQFQIPRTKKDVRAFLGLAGYYRKFICNFASLASALTDLTRKSAPNRVIWTAECDLAFQQLKTRLCSSPVLQAPDLQKPFQLQTDASDRGVGAILSQLDTDGVDHPVAYFSRKLLPREEKYSTVEKECLAIKLGIHAFRVYLLGREFKIITDHRSLEWLDRVKENNPRLTRWSLFLQPYQYKVMYRPGRMNGNADGLSRAPWRVAQV